MEMQLNVYVPRARASILAELDRMSQETGRQKNDIVIEALERYFKTHARELPTFHLGEVKPWKRGDLYEDRLKRQAPR